MVIGAIGALTQPLIKRLLAYSSVSQIGFILLAVGVQAEDSALFYLIQYTLTNTALWLCLISASLFNRNEEESIVSAGSYLNNYQTKDIRTIKELQGLHINNVFLSIAFALLFFSLAGIPPMIGFFAKFEVIASSLNKGFIGLSLIAITASLISATYYIRVIRQI
jgi:NADH-quinone oxidoreductase subunit N